MGAGRFHGFSRASVRMSRSLSPVSRLAVVLSRSCRARRRLIAAAGSGLILVLGLAVAPAMATSARGSGVAARGASAARLSAADAAGAAALASSTGQPVEVLGDRTDFSQTYAEPGGGFQDTESLVPYQVQQPDGSWVPVDTTLSALPGGVVAPAAITTGLSISDGGSGPLYTLTSGTGSLSVSWPYGPLPVPSLSGATATFAGVLPGVNLLVSATPTGVSELVEVTSAAAAANPKLAQIAFPVAASGLSVSEDAAGDLTAADGAGKSVFAAAVPQMWDSAAGPGVAAPSAGQQSDGPLPGDHRAVLAVAAAGGSVSLTPAVSVLSGPQVVYRCSSTRNGMSRRGRASRRGAMCSRSRCSPGTGQLARQSSRPARTGCLAVCRESSPG